MARATGIVETSSTTSEPIDDIPLLLTYLQRIGLQQSIDKHFHSDLSDSDVSLGWLLVIWLAHMLTQSKRQPRHLRSWVTSHQSTLQRYTGQVVALNAVSDIRLHRALTALGDDTAWLKFETDFNRRLLSVFNIPDTQIRLNSVSGQLYVTSEGILQFDQSRRWWSGAIPLRLIVCHLSPSQVPISALAAVGPDDGDTLTANSMRQVRSAISSARVIYISNGELDAEVRASIEASGDGYVCLLDQHEMLQDLSRTEPAAIERLFVTGNEGQQRYVADGYEFEGAQQDAKAGDEIQAERRMLVRSFAQLEQQNRDLDDRLGAAQIELAALNERRRGKRRPRNLDEMRQAADAIVAQYNVGGLIQIDYSESVDTRIVRRYRGRPTMPRTEHLISLNLRLDEAAVADYRKQLGWRVFASNVPAEQLPIAHVAQIELDSPLLLRRVCGKPLSLTAGIVQHAPQIRGLVRLLSLAMRSLALMDHAIHYRALGVGLETGDIASSNGQTLLAERVLELFKELTLTVVADGYDRRYHVTSLSSLQRRMLDILGLPADTYVVRG